MVQRGSRGAREAKEFSGEEYMYQRKRRGGDWVEQIRERGLVIREKE